MASRGRGSALDQRRALAERLREHSSDLEETVFDRIRAIEGSASQNGHHPLRGVTTVVQSALRYGLDAVELGEQHSPPPPPPVIDHARRAAWRSVPFQTINEHYLAGYSIFKDFLLRESTSIETVRQVQGHLDVVYRRLIQAIGEEHQRELQKRSRSSDLRRHERVKQLLSGELQEAPDLQYPLGGTHIGIVGSGPEISSTIRQLFRPLALDLLVVIETPHSVWAWINVQRDIFSSDLGELLTTDLPPETCISVGEPADGLSGWRLTHRQALAARSAALYCGVSIVEFSRVALLASALRDELLLSSLNRQYLHPLSLERDGGKALRETLRAYFSTERNISSAAALLGVKRHTVTNRLRTAEQRLGVNLSDCAAELELALRLEDLT